MRLYLIRHGEASRDVESPDRPLSARGHQQVLDLCGKLRAEDVQIGRLVSSPKARAQETAQHLKTELGYEGAIETWDCLHPDDYPERAADLLHAFCIEHPDKTLLVTGHLPFIPTLTQSLLAPKKVNQSLQLQTAQAICLECREQTGWKFLHKVT